MASDRKQRFGLSAKVVILNEQGQCLALKRSQASANNAGKWDFPGGKIDQGESFDEGLLREVEEERKSHSRLYLSRRASPIWECVP